MEMSDQNFSYICRIGDCEREKLIARITTLEGDADMIDEREMRSNLRIEALEAVLREFLQVCSSVQAYPPGTSSAEKIDARLSKAERAARAALTNTPRTD